MELEKLRIEGVDDIYALSIVQEELKDAVDELWSRYQKKFIQDLAVLAEEKEQAVRLSQYEHVTSDNQLYCMNVTESVRVFYTITDDAAIILLKAFSGRNESALLIAETRLDWLEKE